MSVPRLSLRIREGDDDHFYGPWKGGAKASGGRPGTSGRASTEAPSGGTKVGAGPERWTDHDAIVSEMEGKYPGTSWGDIKKVDDIRLASTIADEVDHISERFGPPPNFRGLAVRGVDKPNGSTYAEVKRLNPDVPGSSVIIYGPMASKAAVEQHYASAMKTPLWNVSSQAANKEEWVQGILAHEMGHTYLGLNHYLRLGPNRDAPVRAAIQPYVDKLMKGYPKVHISQYARREGGHEAWAEVFTAAVGRGKDLASAKGETWVPDLKALLDEWYPPGTSPGPDRAAGKANLSEADKPDDFEGVPKGGQLCGFALRHAQGPDRLALRMREGDDEHFYGPWKGGAKSAGGHPATPAQRAEMEKEAARLARQSRDVSREATTLMAEAKKAEPEVTALLQSVADKTGGRMEGLQYRLKERPRLEEKITNDLKDHDGDVKATARDINDHLRYTVVARSDDNYTAQYAQTVAALEAKGYVPLKVPKDFWGEDGAETPIYQGANAIFHNPATGARFELQFHTEPSILAKTKAHPLFQKARSIDDPVAKEPIVRQMQRLQSKVKRPSGWPPPGFEFRHATSQI
jgi:hypothetical protein